MKSRFNPNTQFQRTRLDRLVHLANFTKGAEDKNAENLLVIRDKVLTAKYVENWKGALGAFTVL